MIGKPDVEMQFGKSRSRVRGVGPWLARRGITLFYTDNFLLSFQQHVLGRSHHIFISRHLDSYPQDKFCAAPFRHVLHSCAPGTDFSRVTKATGLEYHPHGFDTRFNDWLPAYELVLS